MEASDQTQPVAEPDPFAEPAPAAEPAADLPPAPAPAEPIEEPGIAPTAPMEAPTKAEPDFVPDGPEDAPEEPLPGEGEERPTGDAPVDGLAQEGPGEPPQDVVQPVEPTEPPAPGPAAQEPAPAAQGKKERDYSLLEKTTLGALIMSAGFDMPLDQVNGQALVDAIGGTLVYRPIHEVTARNQETAINRTFGPNGPFAEAFEGDVATLPQSHLSTKHVRVGTRTTTAVEIN